LRWRKSDSDLPFWKRKILLSPRTYSLPYSENHRQNRSVFDRNNIPRNPIDEAPTPVLVWRHSSS
jgi:hypothetical protein